MRCEVNEDEKRLNRDEVVLSQTQRCHPSLNPVGVDVKHHDHWSTSLSANCSALKLTPTVVNDNTLTGQIDGCSHQKGCW